MDETLLPGYLADKLMEHCTTNSAGIAHYINTLEAAESNLARVNIVYEDLKRYNLLPQLVRDAKNDSLAIAQEQEGNRYYEIGNYKQALHMYTRSIATSESPELIGLAYSRRAACLFYLQKYGDCIVDSNRALAYNCPSEFREEIIRGREQARSLLRPQWKYHEEVPDIPESQKNLLIQCASNSIKIECNPEYGRHVVATRDIEIGEVIVVEKPFACALKEEPLIHCHHCLELCYNPIPCSSCTQMLFCSEACEIQSQIYHKYECVMQLEYVKRKMDLMRIIVRAALLAKPEYERLETYYFDKHDYYRSDRYKEIYCLNRKSLRAEPYRQLLIMIVATASVFHWLESTDFFENDRVKDHFKEILLTQLQIFKVNGMIIGEYTRSKCRNDYLGFFFHYAETIYSFTSLFSHSCCPNTSRYFYGAAVVIRASNTIKKGEQCFIDYGLYYQKDSKRQRQIVLSRQYSFICKCKACKYDWKPPPLDYSQMMNVPDNRLFCINLHRLAAADLNFAREILPFLIEKLKLCEDSEPQCHTFSLKELIKHCYRSVANTRRM